MSIPSCHQSMLLGHAGVPRSRVTCSNTSSNVEEDQRQFSKDSMHGGRNTVSSKSATINGMWNQDNPVHETREHSNELVTSECPSSACSVSTQSGSTAFSISTQESTMHNKYLLLVQDFSETMQREAAASGSRAVMQTQKASAAALGDLHVADMAMNGASNSSMSACFVASSAMSPPGAHYLGSCGLLVPGDTQPQRNVRNYSLPVKLERSIAVEKGFDRELVDADGILACADMTPASVETPKSFRIMESSSPSTPVVCGFSRELPSELEGQSCTLDMPMLTRYFIGRPSRRLLSEVGQSGQDMN